MTSSVLSWESPAAKVSHNYVSNAYELGVSTLYNYLCHFQQLAQQEILLKSNEPIDSFQTFFQQVDNENETYKKLLTHFQKATPYCFPDLVQLLIAWKGSKKEENMDKKEAMNEHLFCTLLVVILKYRKENNTLQDVTFSALLDSSFASACACAKTKEPDSTQRDLVILYSRVIGYMSRIQPHQVVSTFQRLISIAMEGGNVQEACALLDSMQFLEFSLKNYEEIQRVQSFIELVIQFISKKSKGDITASCYRLVGNILIPLADEIEQEGIDYSAYRSWVTELYYSHRKKWKKLKDPVPALIMEVGILCNGRKDFFAQQPFSVFERLGKLTKFNDKNRSVILDCIFYLILTLLTRYDRVKDQIDIKLILDKFALEIFPAATSKKSVSPHMRSVAVLTDIASLISFFHLDFAVRHFILAGLPPSDYYERAFVAIRSFQRLADRLAISFIISKNRVEDVRSLVFSNRRSNMLRNLREKSRGSLSDESLQPIQQGIGSLLLFLDQQVGNVLPFRPTNENHSLPTSETVKSGVKPYQINLLSDVIRTLFRITPIGMQARQYFAFLAKYCFHSDRDVSLAASQLFGDIMKTRPAFRSVMIEELVTFANVIPDSDVSHLHIAISFLNELLVMWQDPMVLHQLDTDMDSFGNEARDLVCPAFQVEALGLILFCNRNSAIRSDGYSLLENIKKLNEVLPPHLSNSSPRVFMILHVNQKDLLQRIANDSTTLSMNEENSTSHIKFDNLFQLLTSMRIDEQQLIICRCIGEICRTIGPNCRSTMRIAFDCAWNKFSLTNISALSSSKRPTFASNEVEQFYMWRNYLTIIVGAGMGNENTMEPVFQRIIPCLTNPNSLIRFHLKYALQYCCRGILSNFLSHLFSLAESEATKKKDFTIRFEVTQILRYSSSCMDISYIRKSPKIVAYLLKFLKDAFSYLQSNALPTTAFFDDAPQVVLLHFSYDLFRIASCLLEKLRLINSDAFSTLRMEEPDADLREMMFTAANRRCGYGNWKSEQQVRDNKVLEIGAANGIDYSYDIRCTQYWSFLILNEVLHYSALSFANQEIFCDIGPVFTVAGDVYASLENNDEQLPLTRAMTRVLKTFLSYQTDHSDLMFHICVEKSFLDNNAYISQGYFHVVVEALQFRPLHFNYRLSQLLLLGLFKLTDSVAFARHNAVRLLQWLSTRYFRNVKDTKSLLPFASTKTVYEKQFERISASYSSHHPEIVGDITAEIVGIFSRLRSAALTRQLLRLCCAWFMNVSFMDIEDNLEWILQNLVLLTHKLGDEHDTQIERLWHNIASSSVQNVHLTFTTLIELYSKCQQDYLLLCMNKIIVTLFICHPNVVVRSCIKILHRYPPFFEETDLEQPTRYEYPVPDLSVYKIEHEWLFSSIFTPSGSNGEETMAADCFLLCVLSDLVILDISPFYDIIPVLLHCAITQMDHLNSRIALSAKELLGTVASCCAASYLDSNAIAAWKSLQSLEDMLKTSANEYLWPHEDLGFLKQSLPSSRILSDLVSLLLTSLVPCKKTLREEWSQLALFWVIELGNEKGDHVLSRSLQVFRSLECALSRSILNSLGVVLIRSIQQRVGTDIQISLEVMETLRHNSKFTSRKVLRRLPHLFWVAVSMLNSTIPEEFECAVKLLSSLIDEMQVQSDIVYTALLCTEPQRWQPVPYQGLFLLLLKGMCSRKTEAVSRALFTRLAMSPCSQMLHPNEDMRYLIPTIALLPYLITSMGGEDSIEISEKLAGAYILWRKPDMVRLMTEYTMYTTSEEGIRRFIYQSTEMIAKQFFPTYELFIFTVLVELRNSGPPSNERAITLIIAALLAFVDFRSSPLSRAANLPLLGLSSPPLVCKYWEESFVYLESILDRSVHAKQQDSFQLDLKKFQKSNESTQQVTHTWHRLAQEQVNIPVLLALREALNPSQRKSVKVAIANEIDIRDQVKSIKLGKNEIEELRGKFANDLNTKVDNQVGQSALTRDRSQSFQNRVIPTSSSASHRQSGVALGSSRQLSPNVPRRSKEDSERRGRVRSGSPFSSLRSVPDEEVSSKSFQVARPTTGTQRGHGFRGSGRLGSPSVRERR